MPYIKIFYFIFKWQNFLQITKRFQLNIAKTNNALSMISDKGAAENELQNVPLNELPNEPLPGIYVCSFTTDYILSSTNHDASNKRSLNVTRLPCGKQKYIDLVQILSVSICKILGIPTLFFRDLSPRLGTHHGPGI